MPRLARSAIRNDLTRYRHPSNRLTIYQHSAILTSDLPLSSFFSVNKRATVKEFKAQSRLTSKADLVE
eukprot:scaffold622_cov88-Skeletonema_marinoi.AAC.1